MAAAKTRARKPAAKKASKPAAKKQTKKFELADTPFAPGAEVEVYPPEESEVYRADQRQPPSDPITKAKVGDDGSVSFSGLDKGNYVAVAKVAETGGRFGARFGQTTFVVKD